MNELLESSIHVGDSHAELLHEAALILWDEAPMANKAVLACVDATLCKVTEEDIQSHQIYVHVGYSVYIL